MRNKLTPTIAEMNEVVAKYHNKYTTNSRTWVENDADNIRYVSEYKYHSSWDWLHEVWEKVREEIIYIREADEYYLECSYQISEGTPLEALTALYTAIIFINQLKENNETK